MMSLLLNSMLERKEPTRIALMISEDQKIRIYGDRAGKSAEYTGQ